MVIWVLIPLRLFFHLPRFLLNFEVFLEEFLIDSLILYRAFQPSKPFTAKLNRFSI